MCFSDMSASLFNTESVANCDVDIALKEAFQNVARAGVAVAVAAGNDGADGTLKKMHWCTY